MHRHIHFIACITLVIFLSGNLNGQSLALIDTLTVNQVMENASDFFSEETNSIEILHLDGDYLILHKPAGIDTIEFGGMISFFSQLKNDNTIAIIGFDFENNAIVKMYNDASGKLATVSEKVMDTLILDFAVSHREPEKIYYVSDYLGLREFNLKSKEDKLLADIPRRFYTDYDVFRVACSENNLFVGLQVSNDLKLFSGISGALLNETEVENGLRINDFLVLDNGSLIYSASEPIKETKPVAPAPLPQFNSIRVAKTYLDEDTHILYVIYNIGIVYAYSLN